jgi:site-specific DNA-methyltransferase (adenine-specific)
MPGMEAESVDAIVTDPPYGLEFMGKEWDHGIPGVPFWEAALRTAKPGAHLLAFGGTRTHHRLMCAIEDAGWEIRDCLMWVYGSGFPKSHNLKGEWDGWGTALKPAWEPIILARKPLTGTVVANVLEHGTGGLNIDGCRIDSGGETWPGNKENSHSNYSGKILGEFAEQYAKPSHPAGRWPANVVHDGSEEVVGLFPETANRGHTPKARREGGLGCDGHGGQANVQEQWHDLGSAARFFYCAKASRSEREAGLDGVTVEGGIRNRSGRPFNPICDKTGKRIQMCDCGDCEWNTKTNPQVRNNHPTVKPVALMRWLCRLVTPPNGLILDPFCGSGSTGVAAILEGFRFIGIDDKAEYCEIARKRIATASAQTVMELEPL